MPVTRARYACRYAWPLRLLGERDGAKLAAKVTVTRGRYAWPLHVAVTRGRYTWPLHVAVTRGRYMWPLHVAVTRGRYTWPLRVAVTRGRYVAVARPPRERQARVKKATVRAFSQVAAAQIDESQRRDAELSTALEGAKADADEKKRRAREVKAT